MKQETNTKLARLEEKVEKLTNKTRDINIEKLELLLYINVLISLVLLAFVIGAVVKQLN